MRPQESLPAGDHRNHRIRHPVHRLYLHHGGWRRGRGALNALHALLLQVPIHSGSGAQQVNHLLRGLHEIHAGSLPQVAYQGGDAQTAHPLGNRHALRTHHARRDGHWSRDQPVFP